MNSPHFKMPDEWEDLPFVDDPPPRIEMILTTDQADAAFRRRVSRYEPLDEPWTQYCILHDVPLKMVTDAGDLLAAFGGGARFQTVLCRNGRPLLLYLLETEGGGQLVLDDPRLLERGLPALPADESRWPTLRQAVEKLAGRGRSDGEKAGGAAKRSFETALWRVSSDGWPELAAKGLLERPDSPALTDFGREFGLMPVSGPYRPGAPRGKKWPRSVCLPARPESLFLFPQDHKKKPGRDTPGPEGPDGPGDPADGSRLPLDEQLWRQRMLGGTSDADLMRSVDRLMEMPFWKLSVLHAGEPSDELTACLGGKEDARGQDARIRSFGGCPDGPVLTCREAFKKLDAMLGACPFDPARRIRQTREPDLEELEAMLDGYELPFTEEEELDELFETDESPDPWQLLSDIAYKYADISRRKNKKEEEAMEKESLDARLKNLETALPAERGGRFPLAQRGIYSLFGAIDSLELDGAGLYSRERLSRELKELLGSGYDPWKPEPRFEDVISKIWTLLWQEYHPGGQKEASVMPVDPQQAEWLFRLLRELLITPIVRIDALRSLPHRRRDPGRSILCLYSV